MAEGHGHPLAVRKEGTNAKQQHVKGLELNNLKENKNNMHLTPQNYWDMQP
jgi:hypothetical protein